MMRSTALVTLLASGIAAAGLGCDGPAPRDAAVASGAAVASAFEPTGEKTMAVVPASLSTRSALGVAKWAFAVFDEGLLVEARDDADAPLSRLAVGVPSAEEHRAVLEWQGPADQRGLLKVDVDAAVRETSLPGAARDWAERATADLKLARLPGFAYSEWCRLAALQDALSAAAICAGASKTPACLDVAAGAVLRAASNVDATCKVARFPNHALDAAFAGYSLLVTDRVTRTKHTYPQLVRTGCSAQISHTANINGIPGDEVLIEQVCGAVVTFIAVDDLDQRVYRWDVPAGAYVGFTLGDTDVDHPGKEVIALVNHVMDSFSTLYSVKLETGSPTQRVQQTTVPGSIAKVLGVDNLDGGAADGIAIVSAGVIYDYRDAGGGPYAHARYPLATPANVAFAPVDTDGDPGKEVVVRYPTGGIVIIDFARGRTRAYPTADGMLSTAFTDRDGVQGAELCAQFLGGAWGLLVDRTGKFVAANGRCP